MSPSWTKPKTSIWLQVCFPDPFLLPVVERLTTHHREWGPMSDEALLIRPSADATLSNKLTNALEGIKAANPQNVLVQSLADLVAPDACTTEPCNLRICYEHP
jgi:hypothetical protein